MTAPRRFYLLDNMRGLASLSVVVWHYQHFFFVAPGELGPVFSREMQPFYSLLQIFYTDGYQAVQMFFSLSGFVFFLKYFDNLYQKRIDARNFFVLRFSRLYPLHFATLIIVAAGQSLSLLVNGNFIVYPFNDFYHFILQLIFASDWGFQDGSSFNAPIWSVSIEILLYGLFFAFASYLAPQIRNSWVSIVSVIFIAYLAQRYGPTPAFRLVANSAACFFLGGLAFVIWRSTLNMTPTHANAVLSCALFISVLSFATYALVWSNDRLLHGIAFPAAILVLAISQTRYPDLGAKTRLFGDISYSTYLLHFPIQLITIFVVRYFHLNIDFYEPYSLMSFLAAVILLSIPTYYLFELPMQQHIRGLFLGRLASQKFVHWKRSL